MWRLIILGLLVWIIIHFIKRYLRQHAADNAAAKNPAQAVAMVKCEVCNVHLPRAEAYVKNDKFYCSQAHLPEKTQ